MSNGRKAVFAIFAVFFVIVVAILYSIIYVTPLIGGIGKETVIVEYAEFPVQDTVTGIFVREETLYTASYAGSPQYMVAEGTKIRAGTQVVYIDPDAAPPPDTADVQTADAPATADAVIPADASVIPAAEPESTDAAPAGMVTPTLGQVMQSAAGNMVPSEGGVSPTTAIVSYYADGFEKRIGVESVGTLRKTMLKTLPDMALDIERGWANAGEPVYKITNNNSWRFAFWITDKGGEMAKRYLPGTEVTLDLETTKVTAVVESAEPQGDDLFIVLRSDMYYRDLDKFRKQKVHVVFNVYHGAVIDEKSVVERAGVTGVYVRQQSGSFKWIPIHIVRKSEGQYLVSETSYEDVTAGKVSTVRYYDEIMSDPAAEGY
jgi:putative membrane fusion protein